MAPTGQRELTCTERDDDSAGAEPNYNTAGAGEGTIYGIENSQEKGVEALEFVVLAALGTLEFAP